MVPHPRPDALDLMAADRAQARWLFETFSALCERRAPEAERLAVAEEICYTLSIQGQLEDEIFFPSVRQGLDDGALVDEAEKRSLDARDLIAQICVMHPADPDYTERMLNLRAAIERHADTEQQRMFPKVRETDIDLTALAAEYQIRKGELMSEDRTLRDRFEREDESADPVGPPPSRPGSLE